MSGIALSPHLLPDRKQKRFLAFARNDDTGNDHTRGRLGAEIPLSPSNLRPFGAPPSRGRRECPREPLPLEGAAERSEAGLAFFLRQSRLLFAFPIGEGCYTRIPSSKKATHHPCEPIRSPVSSSRAQPRDLYCTAAIGTHAPSLKRHLGASFFAFPSLTVYRSARKIPPLRSS